MSKEHYRENAALLNAAADVERLRGAAANQLHYSVHIRTQSCSAVYVGNRSLGVH